MYNTNLMERILYIIAIVLLIVWGFGFLAGLFTNGIIHILLGVAIIIFLYNILSRARKS